MAGTGSRKMGNAKAPSPSRHTTNKRIGVVSKNTTSAKFEKPAPTAKQTRMKETLARANRNADTRDKLKEFVGKANKGGVMRPEVGSVFGHTMRKFPKGGNI